DPRVLFSCGGCFSSCLLFPSSSSSPFLCSNSSLLCFINKLIISHHYLVSITFHNFFVKAPKISDFNIRRNCELIMLSDERFVTLEKGLRIMRRRSRRHLHLNCRLSKMKPITTR
ncbi:hypothetical protein LINGRAHAP2_LOCUS19424, partial [Linum grandiflorum]